MAWPWKRAEAMLQAHFKREAVQMAAELKNAMITGLWSNPNYDDNKQTRKQAIDQINQHHHEIIHSLYAKIEDTKEEMQHPLLAALEDLDAPSDLPPPRPRPHDEIKLIEELDQG